MLYKIVLKLVEDNLLKWVYFCSVPKEIYDEFHDIVISDTQEINAYVSTWVKKDLGILIRLTTTENMNKIKELIIKSCRKTYSELYIFENYGLIPDEDFWIRLWISSHMKYEIEKRKYNDYCSRL